MAVTKERHLKKYATLSTQDQQKHVAELQNHITIDKSKWVVNLSTKALSPHEKDLLQKGLNFSVTPKISQQRHCFQSLPLFDMGFF